MEIFLFHLFCNKDGNILYLVGKNKLNKKTIVSVNDLERVIYFENYSKEQILNLLNTNEIHNKKMKVVNKYKYNAKEKSEFYKIKYSFKHENIKGDNIYNNDLNIKEFFIIKNKIMGSCWIKIDTNNKIIKSEQTEDLFINKIYLIHKRIDDINLKIDVISEYLDNGIKNIKEYNFIEIKSKCIENIKTILSDFNIDIIITYDNIFHFKEYPIFDGLLLFEEVFFSNDLYLLNKKELNKELNEEIKILKELFEKGNIINLFLNISRITGCPLNETIKFGKSYRLKILLEHKLKEKKILFPSDCKKRKIDDNISYEGGLIIEPEKYGMIEGNIEVIDYNSLYPNIIFKNTICFTKWNILPEICGSLLIKRNEIKNKIIESKENERSILILFEKALKLTTNSLYGCIGFKNFKFYDVKTASLITEIGRNILKETKIFIENKGFKVIYGITDSLFILIENKKELKELLIKEISNKFLPCKIEKSFKILFILTKLSYFGYNEKNELLITGMESKKSNYCHLLHKIQIDLMKFVLDKKNKDEIENELKINYLNKIREFQIEDFIISKKLNKSLENYQNLDDFHLKIANRYHINTVGKTINYLICSNNEPEILSIVKDKKLELDYNYYLNKQILRPLRRIIPNLFLTIEKTKEIPQKKIIYLKLYNVLFSDNNNSSIT